MSLAAAEPETLWQTPAHKPEMIRDWMHSFNFYIWLNLYPNNLNTDKKMKNQTIKMCLWFESVF